MNMRAYVMILILRVYSPRLGLDPALLSSGTISLDADVEPLLYLMK
jgi:hypothetical protein